MVTKWLHSSSHHIGIQGSKNKGRSVPAVSVSGVSAPTRLWLTSHWPELWHMPLSHKHRGYSESEHLSCLGWYQWQVRRAISLREVNFLLFPPIIMPYVGTVTQSEYFLLQVIT